MQCYSEWMVKNEKTSRNSLLSGYHLWCRCLNNNVININKISTSFVILYYFWLRHYFFQAWKKEFSKNLGRQSPDWILQKTIVLYLMTSSKLQTFMPDTFCWLGLYPCKVLRTCLMIPSSTFYRYWKDYFNNRTTVREKKHTNEFSKSVLQVSYKNPESYRKKRFGLSVKITY